MGWLSYLCLLFGLGGHLALWIALFNRIHAMGLPRRVVNVSEKLHVLAIAAVPTIWFWRLLDAGMSRNAITALFAGHPTEAIYFVTCCLLLSYVLAAWVWRRVCERTPPALLANRERTFDVRQHTNKPLVSGIVARLLALVPCNDMTKLCVNEKELALEHLPPCLAGVSIAHLSDLHFTGKLTRAYFDFVIDRTNELDADIIVVTGDIVDKDSCVDWVAATLGRLQARQGKFFVLGNHDRRVSDVDGLRQLLADCGFVDLGSRTASIVVGGEAILLAGNELPWFGRAPQVPPPAAAAEDRSLRILLSHSPDQIPWARRHQFDLMLAGHTHGGQIRFPIVGPIVAPSSYGVKYASGVFDEPPTLVHVSRGISGLDPIRINCTPELTKIILRTRVVSASDRSRPSDTCLEVATSVC